MAWIKKHEDFKKDPKAYLEKLQADREEDVRKGRCQSKSHIVAIEYLTRLMEIEDQKKKSECPVQ